ncbi:GDSL-like Lipase/Acylhydrolase [Colletotrichum higginsianum IMI 349063]|uniref:GDSL-like Lipase/Acylhydrolase n=1 Tax=Colletotrichum higginsianum (strain IMI 349063) TaxID=759273 RepID=A0A1B7XYP9_COLHI|nr:GDSL-like Lipase/Acylhydrolase [Colletotrichum higginsianum IMI 349063]OBR04886.1 GDSL-like Lipase/Acylhydrolase [Colletotrichum higginsianum IMI 349063]
MVSNDPLRFKGSKPGQAIKPGTTLRILCVGDSITVGFLSDMDGGDGNGYRLKLLDDLSSQFVPGTLPSSSELTCGAEDEVVFAGTETMNGTMPGGYFAAWSAMTIKFIAEHVGPSLAQRPNIILIHAGTNDMNPDPNISREGHDPKAAADRLGELIDKTVMACPDATVLVGMIIGCYDETQMMNIAQFRSLIPGIVQARQDAKKHVLAVDFSTFPMNALRDGIHPTNPGYRLMGDYWYDFITQIPSDWIQKPIGDNPRRSSELLHEKSTEKVTATWCQRIYQLVFGKTA